MAELETETEEEAKADRFDDGWFLFTSARNKKKILIRFDDIFMLHEGEKPGTMTIEFSPALERTVETVRCNFEAFLEENIDHMDVDASQKEGPTKGPKLSVVGLV